MNQARLIFTAKRRRKEGVLCLIQVSGFPAEERRRAQRMTDLPEDDGLRRTLCVLLSLRWFIAISTVHFYRREKKKRRGFVCSLGCLIQVPCFPAEERRRQQRLNELSGGWILSGEPFAYFFLCGHLLHDKLSIFTAERRRKEGFCVFDSSFRFSRRGVGEFTRITDACSYGLIMNQDRLIFYREEKEKRRDWFVHLSSFFVAVPWKTHSKSLRWVCYIPERKDKQYQDNHQRNQRKVWYVISNTQKQNWQDRCRIETQFPDPCALLLVWLVRKKQQAFQERNPMFRMEVDSQ